uniref:14.5 kd ORF n=1 Tax=Escherichia coli TaxID=562 RepID=Q51624_ECOLX|nr:14.5 kd ORF [Escherichia coli]
MPGMLFHAALWGTGCESYCCCYHGDKTKFVSGTSHECLPTLKYLFSVSYYPKTILSSVSDSVQRPNNLDQNPRFFSSSSACLSWAISFCSCSRSASWRLRSISCACLSSSISVRHCFSSFSSRRMRSVC